MKRLSNKKKNKEGKFNDFITIFIAVLFIAWVAISYIDVLMHQQTGGTDALWNLFVIISR